MTSNPRPTQAPPRPEASRDEDTGAVRSGCRGCVRFDTQRTLLQAILTALQAKRRMDAATRDRLCESITAQLVLGPDEVFEHAFMACAGDPFTASAGAGCDTLFWLSTCQKSCHYRFVGGTVCALADRFHVGRVR